VYRISPAAAAALQSANQIVAWRLEALLGGQVVFSADNQYMQSGSIGSDITQETWRTLNCQLEDPFGDLTPFVDVYGEELRFWRGIYLPNGTAELMPLGTFGLTDVQRIREPGLDLKIRGADRSEAIKVRQLTDPYTIPAGENYGAAMQAFLRSIIPWLPFSPPDWSTVTSATTPTVTFAEGDDPWTKTTELATAIGMLVGFDGLGNCLLEPIPSVGSSPLDWSYVEGVRGTAVTSGLRSVSSEAYSGVLVKGETSSLGAGVAPPRALVWDTDPTSPTYYLGPFGKRAKSITSPLVTSDQQATDMAVAQLRLVAGRCRRDDFTAIPNPAHEPGDIVRVAGPDFDETHVLENFVIPLQTSDLMTAGSRRRTLR
jgi:hypothetical protein